MSGESSHKAKVLYVDDLQTNLMLFKATLEEDYNIILAESGSEALEILKREEIQVLVTDQRMPEMNGTELLEIVTVEYPDTRRFLLTAFTDFETVVEAVNRGHIHGYINKPIKADEIRISLNNAIEIYNLKKKNRQLAVKLEMANRELINIDGLKSEFIKVISQEIRNPLNRIMGTLHLLKDKIEGQELSGVANVLDSAVSRLEEFSGLTEQISRLTSLESEYMESKVPLKRVIEYSIIEAAEELKQKDIDFDFQIESEEALVRGESKLLVSCLVNIIRYASSHMDSGRNITIKAYKKEEHMICEVIDQGREYSEQLFSNLEEQFSSEKVSFNLNLGIELGLAQIIMQAHMGKIIFERTRENEGSFKLIFK